MQTEAMKITLNFVEKINQGDFQGLIKYLAPDHTFIDTQGDVENDHQKIIDGWQNYLERYPNYQIYIRRTLLTKNRVVLIGHTTGSHLNLPDAKEFHEEGVIWVSQVDDAKLSLWQLLHDTVENYQLLNLDESDEFFPPAWLAATIAKHLDLLPPESRTRDVRNVRKYYSRLYRNAPPETLLAIAEHLLFDQGYRFVPYELIYYHPGTIKLLNPDRVVALGKGIATWSSTDIYAHFIVGPAWKKGVISDETIDEWIHTDNIWWRRAALVSTIYLYGDVERMLKYGAMLVDDKEDMIIKALSWVLREASAYDPEAVRYFLLTHEDRLASRVKREVQNKLDTGLKYPQKN